VRRNDIALWGWMLDYQPDQLSRSSTTSDSSSIMDGRCRSSVCGWSRQAWLATRSSRQPWRAAWSALPVSWRRGACLCMALPPMRCAGMRSGRCLRTDSRYNRAAGRVGARADAGAHTRLNQDVSHLIKASSWLVRALTCLARVSVCGSLRAIFQIRSRRWVSRSRQRTG
jgi:hypothetical protein